MAEWSMAAVLKTVDRKVRGFESCSLRQKIKTRIHEVWVFCFSIKAKNGEMAEWPKAIAC
jgi:hypothetical protein